MRLTVVTCVRRILNSPYSSVNPLPKPLRWWKKERLFRWSAWNVGDQRDVYRVAINNVQHSWVKYNELGQIDAKYDDHFRAVRLTAALEEHRVSYDHFTQMLTKAGIRLDLAMLSNLAIFEPQSFKALAMLTKKMAEEDGFKGVMPKPSAEFVITRGEI